MTVLEDSPLASALPADPSPERLREILDRQHAASLAEGIPDAEVRLDRVDRFVLGVLEAAEELSEALDADFGSRPRPANLASDIISALGPIAMIREHLADWMRDEEVPGSAEAGTPTFVHVRPKGVVGVIGPWNFPVGLVVHPTINALAAGDRVMIKFSDIPERTADVFACAVARHMDPTEVTVVRGGLDTARAFSDLPFDHIIFTGSPGVGVQVAAAAGRNLVPVTLELGGKNPVVISLDADLAQAAERIAAGPVEGAPSGGIGMSGMGAYTGLTGFRTFSRTVTASERPAGMATALVPPSDAAGDAIAGMIAQGRAAIEARIAERQS